MGEIEAPRDFVEFLNLLIDHDVEFAVIGGFAVAVHGQPRATKDIDVWIRRSVANAERVAAAIRDFGFDLPSVTADSILAPDRIVRMGEEPVRIEVMADIEGADFETAADRLVTARIGGVEVPVIGLEDLIANKTAVGRLQDATDVEALRRFHRREAD